MDVTITTHSRQNSLNKESSLVMSGEKILIVHTGQAITHLVSDFSEAPLTDSLTGILKEEYLSRIKEEVCKAKYIEFYKTQK